MELTAINEMALNIPTSLKKILPCIVLLACIANQSSASPIDSTIYAGLIHLKPGGQYSYKLCLYDSGNNRLGGYSITDVRGKYETKTEIAATRLKNGVLQIQEQNVVYSKATNIDLCFIFTKLKEKTIRDVPMLQGAFTGRRADGKTTCASGSITLFGSRQLLNKLIQIAPPRPPENATAPESEKKRDTFSLTKSNQWQLYTKDTSVSIQIWDNNRPDGDMISIFLNGLPVKENYRLTNEPLRLIIPIIRPAQNLIEVIAVSEGSEPPNTGMVRIATSKGEDVAQANLALGETGRIIINAYVPKDAKTD